MFDDTGELIILIIIPLYDYYPIINHYYPIISHYYPIINHESSINHDWKATIGSWPEQGPTKGAPGQRR